MIESHAFYFKEELGYDLFRKCDDIASRLGCPPPRPSPRVSPLGGDPLPVEDMRYYGPIIEEHKRLKDQRQSEQEEEEEDDGERSRGNDRSMTVDDDEGGDTYDRHGKVKAKNKVKGKSTGNTKKPAKYYSPKKLSCSPSKHTRNTSLATSSSSHNHHNHSSSYSHNSTPSRSGHTHERLGSVRSSSRRASNESEDSNRSGDKDFFAAMDAALTASHKHSSNKQLKTKKSSSQSSVATGQSMVEDDRQDEHGAEDGQNYDQDEASHNLVSQSPHDADAIDVDDPTLYKSNMDTDQAYTENTNTHTNANSSNSNNANVTAVTSGISVTLEGIQRLPLMRSLIESVELAKQVFICIHTLYAILHLYTYTLYL